MQYFKGASTRKCTPTPAHRGKAQLLKSLISFVVKRSFCRTDIPTPGKRITTLWHWDVDSTINLVNQITYPIWLTLHCTNKGNEEASPGTLYKDGISSERSVLNLPTELRTHPCPFFFQRNSRPDTPPFYVAHHNPHTDTETRSTFSFVYDLLYS